MTAHLRTDGLSRRAYAKSRQRSESSVRQAIDDGRLKGALLPNGKIDPEKADDLLAASTTAGSNAPSELSDARRRKFAAQCEALRDDVEALEASVVRPDEATAVLTEECTRVAQRLFRLSDELAPAVAGKPAPVSIGIIQDAVYAAVTELTTAPDQEGEADDGAAAAESLDEKTSTELAAMKATLQARRLEIVRDLRRGVVLDIATITVGAASRFASVRTRVLGLHTRCAQYMGAATETQALALLRREIADAVEQMACKLVPLEPLLSAGTENPIIAKRN